MASGLEIAAPPLPTGSDVTANVSLARSDGYPDFGIWRHPCYSYELPSGNLAFISLPHRGDADSNVSSFPRLLHAAPANAKLRANERNTSPCTPTSRRSPGDRPTTMSMSQRAPTNTLASSIRRRADSAHTDPEVRTSGSMRHTITPARRSQHPHPHRCRLRHRSTSVRTAFVGAAPPVAPAARRIGKTRWPLAP